MYGLALSLACAVLFPAAVLAQIWPANIPLAVRTPYFNSYLDTAAGRAHANEWPQFWTLDHIVAWDLWIMVDGINLQLFGGGGTAATNLTNVELTPTRSILTIQANTMEVTVTFLSPIEPSDLARQSLPFVYMYVDAQSTDGQTHSIQLYSDVTAEWLSYDLTKEVQWSTSKSASLMYHTASQTDPSSMTETNSVAEDSTLYYAFPAGDGVTYRTGDAAISRPQWASNKTLDDFEDTNFRAINDAFPTFSFAVDLGTISSTSDSVMWAFGLTRDPSIQYTTQDRHSYFWTKYSTIGAAIADFVSDFKDARDRAVAFDSDLTSAAKNISDEYATVVSVAARQAMAGVEITVSKASDGSWNETDVMSFMKDTGVSRRVNPVDVMYPAFPAFLTINSTWAGYLLEPLLRVQRDKATGANYAMPDLGTSFPTANAHLSPPVDMSIENSGDMLFMVWAQATVSGDATLIKSYYTLLKTWADYLVGTSATPSGFEDADDVDNANLGLKGIIGIKCMAEIANAVDESDDAALYSANATEFISEWESKAVVNGHIVSGYGNSASWGLIYNLYADRLLGTKLVNDTTLTNQDVFYNSELSSSGGTYGLPYDSSVSSVTKSTWSMLVAASTLDTSFRNSLIGSVYAKMTNNASAGVFPTTYSFDNGTTSAGVASPAQGAAFSLLALNLKLQTPSGGGSLDSPSDTSDGSSGDASGSGSSSSNAGPIAGGVIGGLVFLGLVGAGIFFYRRRQQKTREPEQHYFREVHPRGSDTQLLGIPPPNQVDPQYHVEPYAPAPRATPLVVIPPDMPVHSKRSPTSATATNTTTPWSPETTASGSNVGSSASGSDRLRDEVENLRREMEQIRAQTMYAPPPEYEVASGSEADSSSASGGMPAGTPGSRALPAPPRPREKEKR